MEFIQDISGYECDCPSVVTLGKFDGVHRGHRKLISAVKKAAHANGWKACVFTFETSPQICMGERRLQMLMTNEERRRIFRELDMDVLIECVFTEEMRRMTAETFVREVLVNRMHAACVVIGEDFRFGRNRSGNPEFLREAGVRFGFEVKVLEKETDDGIEISSTYIREELRKGRMQQVNRLLGYPYFVTGEIVHGRHLGHSLGFPTINQIPDPEKMLPPNGVYISQTTVGGRIYQGVSNVGRKPTVNGDGIGVETYLFDCSLDLYGQIARVELLAFRRPEMKFNSIEELQHHMEADIAAADIYFEQNLSEAEVQAIIPGNVEAEDNETGRLAGNNED